MRKSESVNVYDYFSPTFLYKELKKKLSLHQKHNLKTYLK